MDEEWVVIEKGAYAPAETGGELVVYVAGKDRSLVTSHLAKQVAYGFRSKVAKFATAGIRPAGPVKSVGDAKSPLFVRPFKLQNGLV